MLYPKYFYSICFTISAIALICFRYYVKNESHMMNMMVFCTVIRMLCPESFYSICFSISAIALICYSYYVKMKVT